MSVLALLVFLVVIGLVYWAAMQIIAAFGLPAAIAVLVKVALVVVAVLWLLQWAGLTPLRGLR